MSPSALARCRRHPSRLPLVSSFHYVFVSSFLEDEHKTESFRKCRLKGPSGSFVDTRFPDIYANLLHSASF